jgi:hypothetical protein
MDRLLLVALGVRRDRGDDQGRPPIVIANPVRDRLFRKAVDEYLLTGGRRADELEAVLRVRYPHAVVRPRELDGERSVVWYAYREGHWIRGENDVQA